MKKRKIEGMDSFTSMAAYGNRNRSDPDYLDWGRTSNKYTSTTVSDIVEGTSLEEKIILSRHFFKIDGYYQRMVLHYAGLLKWSGLLTPQVVPDKKITDSIISRRYYQALDYLDTMDLENFLAEVALRVYTDGTYYGVQANPRAKEFTYLTLPTLFCRTIKVSPTGKPLIEFNVTYFDKISSKIDRSNVLKSYPKEVSRHYWMWTKKQNSNPSPWVIIPEDIGLCFRPYGETPALLSVIPKTLEYETTLARNAVREEEEIKKLLIQKIPHLSNGEFLLEPPEAEELHRGAVDMLKEGNPNMSVVTTYADVEVQETRTSSEAGAGQVLDRVKSNIYSQVGAPQEVFSPSGSSSTALSLQNDLSFTMLLANKMSETVSRILTTKFGNGNINFVYTILAVSWYNEREFIDRHFKMAGSGYSLLVPAIASGFSQKEFVALKALENDLLGMRDLLIPFHSAFNSSSEDTADEKTPGREEKEIGERSDKTEQNKQIIDEGGETSR